MKTDITKEDVLKLIDEFISYAKQAEQYAFPILMMVQSKLEITLRHFDETSIEELNAMFRTIYKIIGKEYSEFES